MPVVKKVPFDKEEEFFRIRMGRLIGEDAAEAQIARSMFSFLKCGGSGSNLVRKGAKPWRGISRGEHTKHFAALATYIAKPETDDKRERLQWLESRNLPGMDGRDLDQAKACGSAFWMGASAGLSTQLQKRAAIHYIVSFHPNDTKRLSRDRMRNIADQCLYKIGAERHQALIGCHIDRNHKHIHLIMNRVHPVSNKPLNEFRDLIKLEQLMRQIETSQHFVPVQGRHFDLKGAPLPSNFIGKPRKRSQRPKTLGSVRKALASTHPFREAGSWDDLHQRLSEKDMEIRNSGTRIEIGKIKTGPYVPANDLFGVEASIKTLEQRYGCSYSDWKRDKSGINQAKQMGLRFDEYLLWQDEIQVREKARVRRIQIKKKKKKMARLMKIAGHPARKARSPSMYNEETKYYGPAISRLDIAEAVEKLPTEIIGEWCLITRKAIRKIENDLVDLEIEGVNEMDLSDALFHMKDGLKSIERYAKHRGVHVRPTDTTKSAKQSEILTKETEVTHQGR